MRVRVLTFSTQWQDDDDGDELVTAFDRLPGELNERCMPSIHTRQTELACVGC